MKSKISIIAILMMSACLTLTAATKQEMEQARALTAKWGVRSQNSGAGYLDGTNPKNMSQLQNTVNSHSRDKDNLGKLNLSMPSESEYQSWDNAKMTSYWVSQYNASVPAGGDKSYCLGRLKSQLGGVPATVTVTENPDDNAAPEEGEETVESETDTTTVVETEGLSEDALEGAAVPETEPVPQPGTDGERKAAEGNKPLASGGSNVWVIIMLVVLVLAVLVLVGYASNLMARNKREEGNPRRRKNGNGAGEVSESVEKEMMDRMTGQPAQAQSAPRPSSAAAAGAAAATAAASHKPAPRITQPRIIYLSQANSEGVFLRADAHYNMGNSIFKLVTSDGYSGTFSVIDDPNVHELALMMPNDFLVNACSGRNLQLSRGARGIVTDSAGTAVFEDGRWRVARKAQIHYTA